MADNEEKKKAKTVKIAGFHIKVKTLVILGVVVAVIFGISKAQEAKKQAEIDRQIQEQKDAAAAAEAARLANQTEPLTRDELLQQQLVEQFGTPPDGFKWNTRGELVPIADDSDPETVLYRYMRALSVLDMATAQSYSSDSSVISYYTDFYGATSYSNDYYDNFLRKQYKASLGSLEVVETKDTAVFADGTMNITVVVSALDLSNKDFWLVDKKEIFDTLYSYEQTEDDDAKAEQYIYDYLIDAYESGMVGKAEHTIELVLEKGNGSGWLVTQDMELKSILSYQSGVDVTQYIFDQFYDWERDSIRSDDPGYYEGDDAGDTGYSDSQVESRNRKILANAVGCEPDSTTMDSIYEELTSYGIYSVDSASSRMSETGFDLIVTTTDERVITITLDEKRNVTGSSEDGVESSTGTDEDQSLSNSDGDPSSDEIELEEN